MRNVSAVLAAFCLPALAVGCAAPDFVKRTFGTEVPVAMNIATIASAGDCATPESGPRVQRFNSPDELRAWAAGRNIADALPADLADADHAVVELGNASNTNGFAIAPVARLTGRELDLKFSTFSLERSRPPAPAPCVVIALPRERDTIRSVTLRGRDDGVVATTAR